MTEPPSSADSAGLADWVEVLLLKSDAPRISETRIARLLRGELVEVAEDEFEAELDEEEADASEPGGESDNDEHAAESGDAPDEEMDLGMIGAEGEANRDTRIDLLLEEIELREQLGSNVYPFRVVDTGVERVSVCGERTYRFLLVLSSATASYRKDLRTNEVERAYDLVAMAAMKMYFGHDASGVRFAKNSHDPEDATSRPKKFRAAIEWLRDHLDAPAGIKVRPDDETEEHWEMREAATGQDTRHIPNSYSDGGVDIVVWWRFKDGRRGFPVLLAQCTVQLTWETKVHDVKRDLWPKWIDFSMVPPQRALVIPFAVSRESTTFEDRSVEAGVVIDRLRLLELLEAVECNELEALVDGETQEWVDRELATIP